MFGIVIFSCFKAKNKKKMFVCPLPTYSPKMGPTQKQIIALSPDFKEKMFLSEDKLFSLESNVFSFKPHWIFCSYVQALRNINATVIVRSFDKIVANSFGQNNA